jgi:hypothetical protein
MIHGALPGKIGWHIGEPFAVKFAHDNSDMLFSIGSKLKCLLTYTPDTVSLLFGS